MNTHNNNSLFPNISRKELASFQSWLKSLPFNQTHFLYQSYFTDDVRKQKVLELYQRWLKVKDQTNPLTPPQKSV